MIMANIYWGRTIEDVIFIEAGSRLKFTTWIKTHLIPMTTLLVTAISPISLGGVETLRNLRVGGGGWFLLLADSRSEIRIPFWLQGRLHRPL